MRTKIGIYLSSEPESGGMFQYGLSILDAAASLPRDRYQTTVAFISERWNEHLKFRNLEHFQISPNFLWRIFKGKGWLLLNLPISFWRWILINLNPFFYKRLIQEGCDLWLFPSQDTWTYLLRLNSLGVVHDLMHRYEKKFSEVAAPFEYRRRERHYRAMCEYSKGILVDSNYGKRQVLESYDAKPDFIHVLPYVPPEYINIKNAPIDFDSRYNLPRKFLFYPAQFWEHKNHHNLLAALAHLKRELRDIHVVLVGSKKNAYKKTLGYINSMNLSDHVIILGYVPNEDMAEFYRRARALVFPSFFGPTNIPPLEACAAGCPLAVSNIYGMPEQLGDAALFFNPHSVEEIHLAMKRLWIDDALCRQLSMNGKKWAKAWNQNSFNRQFQVIIEEVLKNPNT
ncbi:glycosyltransferase family 4 protein [Syntrophus aciditrophicus]|uniref:Mannosyltransferase n=1 Tax=Syntrophus aciditrophicus (strain SB) TaxID=56780 RepID=Q2LVP0_SYNAS|nr:glycosyltransferase family 1 protein [Syntrophus aciditrophicus]ABC78151.1 mannosyltransferase [Syntrophus aciditrophicus SB]OPY16205.1 MAG: Mannosylfructose-phosphate synthase [Syntrophus sp. PtaB.Bin075]